MSLKRMLLVGNILLLGFIVWAGVSIIITFISNWHSAEPALSVLSKMSMPKNHTSSKDKRLEDYALIVSKDIFHTTKETSATALNKRIEDIGKTELNLELKGTVVGEGKDSYAFILNNESGTEALYYPNDYVMGAQILKILKDRIVLNVDGKAESLLMVSMETKGASAALRPGVRRPPTLPPRPATPPQRRIITPRRGGGK
jgi:type II secretory pathway component PulC